MSSDKKEIQYLTNKEYELMKVFWASEEPISSADVMALETERSWSDSSLHPLINKLLQKDFIKVVGQKKATKNNTRLFEANITLDEYVGMQVRSVFQKNHKSLNILDFMLTFVKSTSQDDQLLAELETLLDNHTAE